MKKHISIKYFFNFKEDNRKSMEMISEYLYQNLKKDQNFKTTKFIPNFSKKFDPLLSGSWNLRYNRYSNYPNLVKNLNKTDIAHIIDHQYAHLVHKINADKKIVTVHDLIPIKFKRKIGKNPHLVKYSLSHLKYFDQVIAVSENTKRDIIKYTDCPRKKIKVLYSSVDKNFNSKKIDIKKVCLKHKIPYSPKKILIVGSSFYKNHQISLKILENLKKRYNNQIILLKIGNKLDFKINKELKKNIFELDYLNRKKINEIYKICDLLLFPSIYEGYGLPCLEAMKTKLPIVASNTASIKEILGNYSLLFYPKDVKKMTDGIIKLIENKNYNNQIKKYLKTRSNNFKEEDYFKKLKNIYLI